MSLMAYLRNRQKKLSIINSQFSTINYPGLRAAERPTNRAEVYAEPVEVKSNRAETKFNRAEVKSNRAGTGIPLAMRFCSYAKKMNLQGNTLALFRARFARIARILT